MNRYQLWCFINYAPNLPLLDGWVMVGFYEHIDTLEAALKDLADGPLTTITEYKIVHVAVTAEGTP